MTAATLAEVATGQTAGGMRGGLNLDSIAAARLTLRTYEELIAGGLAIGKPSADVVFILAAAVGGMSRGAERREAAVAGFPIS